MFPLSQLEANADFTYTGLLILLWKKWMHYLSFARSIFLWCFTTSSVAKYAHTSSPITYSNMPELVNVLAWQKKCGLFLRSNIDLQSAFILSKLIQVSVRNLFVVALQWVIRLHLPLVKAFPAFWIYSMVSFQKAKNFNCAITRTSMVLSLVFYINFCVPILSQSLWSLTVAISFLSGTLTSLVPFEALKIISKSCIPAVAPSEVLNILR